MLIKVDAKALEWRVKAYLAHDEVALHEIIHNIDQHSAAQKEFNLPSRLIAKKFNFRMIFADAYSEMGFRRPAYAYANDAEFSGTSSKIGFWEEVCSLFFQKYKGMYQHGLSLLAEVRKNGKLETVTGRVYDYSYKHTAAGEPYLPHTTILNYPVQGLASELMALARVVLRKRLKKAGFDLQKFVLFVNTIHDDIELDVDNSPDLIYNICIELEKVFVDLPNLFGQYYGVKFDCPLAGEVSYGYNLHELVEFKRENKNICV